MREPNDPKERDDEEGSDESTGSVTTATASVVSEATTTTIGDEASPQKLIDIMKGSSPPSTPLRQSSKHVVQQYHLHRTSPISPVVASSLPLVVTPTEEEEKEGTKPGPAHTLAEKRHQLGRQRVQLEQRLFEYASLSRAQAEPPTAWAPEEIPTSQSPVSSSVESMMSLPLSSSKSSSLLLLSSTSCSSSAAAAATILSPPPTKSRFKPLTSTRWEDLEFPDGQVYQGQVKIRLERATGTTTTTDYIRHGHGWNRWPDGQTFRGSWLDNHRHGRGTQTWPDGRSVTGPWVDGHLHGRVFFVWPDQSTYDGDAVQGKKEGRGIHTWRYGNDQQRVYAGQYEAGYEHGFGMLTDYVGTEQLSKYRGQFRYGKRHGYGVQTNKDKTYDGEWRNNLVHGVGKLCWNHGASYTGGFRLGRYHGSGTYDNAQGKRYIGQWRDGYKHGMGKQFWPNGDVYIGNFLCGKRHGYGQFHAATGFKYSGGWKDGKRSGQGIEVGSGGNVVHCGLWKRNRSVEQEGSVNPKQKPTETRDDMHLTGGKPKAAVWQKRRQAHDAESILFSSRTRPLTEKHLEDYKEEQDLDEETFNVPRARSLEDNFKADGNGALRVDNESSHDSTLYECETRKKS